MLTRSSADDDALAVNGGRSSRHSSILPDYAARAPGIAGFTSAMSAGHAQPSDGRRGVNMTTTSELPWRAWWLSFWRKQCRREPWRKEAIEAARRWLDEGWLNDDQWEPSLDIIGAIRNAMADDYDASRNECAKLLRTYCEGSASERAAIDNVLICVCGWSVPTLIRIAQGGDPYFPEDPVPEETAAAPTA
jgi:hypothetical protein